MVAAADDGPAKPTQATLAFLLDRWWEQKRGRPSISTAAYRRIVDRQVVPELGTVKPAMTSERSPAVSATPRRRRR